MTEQESPALPAEQQHDGPNAFAGLDMTAARALADERRAAEQEETEGGYAPRKFRLHTAYDDEVFEEVGADVVHQEEILLRDELAAKAGYFVPIVTVRDAVRIIADLDGVQTEGGDLLYTRQINDEMAVAVLVHEADRTWLWVEPRDPADTSQHVVLDVGLGLFEPVE